MSIYISIKCIQIESQIKNHNCAVTFHMLITKLSNQFNRALFGFYYVDTAEIFLEPNRYQLILLEIFVFFLDLIHFNLPFKIFRQSRFILDTKLAWWCSYEDGNFWIDMGFDVFISVYIFNLTYGESILLTQICRGGFHETG